MNVEKKGEESAKPPAPSMFSRAKVPLILAVFSLLAILFKGNESFFLNKREGVVPPSSQDNQAPKIIRAEIVPPFPNLQSALNVEMEAVDADQDPITYRYRWLVNQKVVSQHAVLPLSGFRQGDLVAVEITPSDEKTVGVTFQSSAVKIGNNPPVVTSIQLSPEEPKPGQPVQVEVKGLDQDGDSIRYRYEWRVNGQPAGNDTESLDGSFVHSADQIAVIVIPSDFFSEGPAKISPLVTAMNQAPKITSLPPGKIQNDKYTYQVIAQDPDGDPLHYLLLSGPSGMALDGSSGFLDWKAEALHEDKSQVTIEVNDAKGGKSIQQFTLQTK